MKIYQAVFIAFSGLIFFGCNTQQKTQTSASVPEVTTTVVNTDTVTIPEDAIVVQPKPYRGSNTIVNDLVHTKLDIKFDWQQQYAFGKAWITLKPHFYPTDSLTIDAKGFDLHAVELVSQKGNQKLKYSYDSLQIKITLNRTYRKDEEYTLYIDYTAKPNELKSGGSAAINDDRGLYFINHLGKNKDVPRQLWTQ